MDNQFYVLSEGVLGLETNELAMKWSYGITPPLADQNAYDACAVRLKFFVDDIDFGDEKSNSGKYHYFFGKPGVDAINYQRAFFLNSELRLRAQGLVTGLPTIAVNRPYYKFINYRFMNLHSPGYILTDVASLMLLRHNFAPLHCSAFKYKDATVVVFAPPNTGKTLSTMMACMEFEANFIAEDLAITDGETVFSVPWTSTFRYYDNVESSRWVQLINRLTEKIPLLELAPMVKVKPISSYLGGTDKIINRSEVTHLVILERDTVASVQPVDFNEAFKKIINLNRYEFNYHKAPLTVAYEFFNPSLDLENAVQSERRILKNLIDKTDKVFVVKSPDATKYAQLIIDTIE